MRVFVVLAVVIAAAFAGQNIVNLASEDPRVGLALFKEYQTFYQRDYPASERRMRLALFRKFIKDAAAYNAAEEDVEYGLTVFADLTDAEAENMYGLNSTGIETSGDHEPVALSNGLGSADHKSRYGPVKNQGRTNACWSFAATAVMEGYGAISSGSYVSLSEQETADCTSGSTIARGGFHDRALRAIQRQNHLATLRDYPFVGYDRRCNARSYRNALPYRISGVYQVRGDRGLAQALDSGPVAAGMSFNRQVSMYRGGIFSDNSCNYARPNHAVTVIGYGSNYWEIRNSYGSRGWGVGGYGKFTRRMNNMCNVSDYSFYISINRVQEEKEE